MKYVISVDAGTTCFKAGLYSSELKPLSFASEEYTLLYPAEGFVEFPAEQYYAMLCRLIAALLSESGVSGTDVAGISFSCQGETLICMDRDGTPLTNAIIWTDARAVTQAEKLHQKFSDETVFSVTGQREMTPSWPAPKILWLAENKPGLFKQARHFMLLADYLIFRLTGNFCTDKSLSTSTLYMDIRSDEWWQEMLSEIGITAEMLPRLLDCGAPAGSVTAEAAAQTGLSLDTVVCAGAFDQAACMLGAGNIKPGMITETTGTCLAVCANIGNAHMAMKNGILPVHRGILPHSYYTIYWSGAAGSIYRWLRDLFFRDDPSDKIFMKMDQEASDVAPGCEGLYLLPYLSGMNYPFACEKAKGSFFGMDFRHTRGHFLRAALEAVAFLLRQSVDELSSCGISSTQIYSLGGGAASPVWCRIKANIAEKEICTLKDNEVGCLGAAILAAVGCKLKDSIEAAAEAACVVKKTYLPDAEAASYRKVYAEFAAASECYANSLRPR